MEPIEIHVRLSPDDEVLALRARVAELEAQAEAATTRPGPSAAPGPRCGTLPCAPPSGGSSPSPSTRPG